MVKEGSADAAIATELSARFMVDYYYQKNMHFFRLPDMPGASVSFAISSHEPMLKSVMDKALQAIPPREILQMTEKWSKISIRRLIYGVDIANSSINWGYSRCC